MALHELARTFSHQLTACMVLCLVWLGWVQMEVAGSIGVAPDSSSSCSSSARLGSQPYKPRVVSLPFPAQSVQCSARYTMVLTKMHTLHGWGMNTYGQLGVGESNDDGVNLGSTC